MSYVRAALKDVDLVVMEDFMPYQGKRMQFDKAMIQTVKLIGRIEEACANANTRCVLQQASSKNIGFKVTKVLLSSTSDPQRHWKDAYAHVGFWCHLNKNA